MAYLGQSIDLTRAFKEITTLVTDEVVLSPTAGYYLYVHSIHVDAAGVVTLTFKLGTEVVMKMTFLGAGFRDVVFPYPLRGTNPGDALKVTSSALQTFNLTVVAHEDTD